MHAMLNYRLLPLEDGGNLHLIGDHGVYQFALATFTILRLAIFVKTRMTHLKYG